MNIIAINIEFIIKASNLYDYMLKLIMRISLSLVLTSYSSILYCKWELI